MAGKRIPLPKYSELPEGVYFHHRLPGDAQQLVLQVPNEDRTDSETYLVDRTDSGHKGWLEGLPHSRHLLDRIAFAPHVAYCVTTGYVEELPDLDEPGVNEQRIALARQQAGRGREMDRRFGRGHRRNVPPPSTFRQALMGRGEMR